jgi:hypothetical protein
MWRVTVAKRIQDDVDDPVFEDIGLLDFDKLTVTRKRTGIGDVTAEAHVGNVDPVIADAIMSLTTQPLEISVDDGSRNWLRGPLTAVRFKGEQVTIRGNSLEWYLNEMRRTTDYSVTSYEQVDIVFDLIDDYQALTYGNFGFDLSSLPGSTGVTRDLVLEGVKADRILDVLMKLGEMDDGFELYVDEDRVVNLGRPRGSDKSVEHVIDFRTLAQPEVSFLVNDRLASHVRVYNREDPTIYGEVENTAIRDAWGRLHYVEENEAAQTPTAAVDAATKIAATMAQVGIEVIPDTYAERALIEELDVGDEVGVLIETPFGQVSNNLRIDELKVIVSGNSEQFDMEFIEP